MTAALAPVGTQASPVIAPIPGANRTRQVGQITRVENARRVLARHKAGLAARRSLQLIWEKLLLHIDGSGDFQYADIWNNQKVEIPRDVSGFRKSENLLRPVVDNAVAHHTTMPLRLLAESLADRVSRDKALMDTLFINYLFDQQDVNGLTADALYMAMASGFCPLHRYWRDDPMDAYEPIEYEGQQLTGPMPGMIDCWLGNPFGTVFDPGARRGSVHRCSYERWLPASRVREAFGDVPGIEKLEGTDRVSSTSEFQRIARKWRLDGLGIHGSPIMNDSQGGTDDQNEMVLVLCEEILPGLDADHPDGWLQMLAVPGSVDLATNEGSASEVFPLADQALPAGDFSWTNFYSHHRVSDVLGKPWVEEMDPLQVDLNIALSRSWEYLQKNFEAPIVAPGGQMGDDMLELDGLSVLEIDPAASWRPQALQWPPWVLQGIEKVVDQKRQAIYTLGGYQAVSRGELPGSRVPYRAIVALQNADNTIHGPVNVRFRQSIVDMAKGCWRLMKQYGSVAWLVDIGGAEYQHLAAPYIDRTKLSDRPPNYKVVSGFGTSPEQRAQEVLELMGTRGADGEVFLTTREARRAYPNHGIFDDSGDPTAVKRRRAKTVANAILALAAEIRTQAGMKETALGDQRVQMAGMAVFGQIELQYPMLRDDDLQAHLDTLTEITQDETADAIARFAAQQRQNRYYLWQSQMAVTPGLPGPAGAKALPSGSPNRGSSADPRNIVVESTSGGRAASAAEDAG